MKKMLLPLLFSLTVAVLLVGCAPKPSNATIPPAVAIDPVAQAESSQWFLAIRPAVATLGKLAIGLAVSPSDKHDKELLIYDSSHAFWSLTGSNTFDPAAITSVVGGWLPTKPWWDTVLGGVSLAFTPLKNWVTTEIAKVGGQTTANVFKVWNDALNQAALGAEDCTYADLGFPKPPQ